MRALRSRTVQSDNINSNENDENDTESRSDGASCSNEYVSEKNVSKEDRRKKKKEKKLKHEEDTSEFDKDRNEGHSGSNEQVNTGYSVEKNICIKVKQKKSNKLKHKNSSELDNVRSNGASGSIEHEREDSSVKIDSKEGKRKKLKKRKHNKNNSELDTVRSADNSGSNEQEKVELGTPIEKNISIEVKRKKSKKLKHKNISESDKVRNSGDSISNKFASEDLCQSTEKRLSTKSDEDESNNSQKIKINLSRSSLSRKSLNQSKIKHNLSSSNVTVNRRDTFDKSVSKLDTFNKTERLQQAEITSDEDETSNSLEMKKTELSKSKLFEKSLNQSKIKHSLSTSNRTSSRRNTFEKSDSKQNTSKKVDTLQQWILTSDEDESDNSQNMKITELSKSKLSDENLNQSKSKHNVSTRNVIFNRRETFDKSASKQDTFNKTERLQQEITSDEDETNNSLEIKKSELSESKLFEKGLNQSKIKHSLNTSNRTSSRRNTFEKTVSKQNTSKKGDTLQQWVLISDEDESDNSQNMEIIELSKSKLSEENLNQSKTTRNVIFNRSETFEKSALKRDTFNKTEITSDEDETNKSLEMKTEELSKSNIFEQSLNQGITKHSFTINNENTINRSDIDIFKIVNTSGGWKVDNNQTKISTDGQNELNSTFEIENKENDTQSTNSSEGNKTVISIENTTVINENVSSPPTVQSIIRKKWTKHPRYSSDAQLVLDQISSPILKKKMIIEKIINTPKELYKLQKPSAESSYLSVKKTGDKKMSNVLKISPLKSTRKSVSKSTNSVIKRTPLPNFALIHKKAAAKLENVVEYSIRTQKRADMFMSSNKKSMRKSRKSNDFKTEGTKLKSLRQLFPDNNSVKYNRFGFKLENAQKPAPNTSIEQKTKIQPINKPSVFQRTDVVAIANKNAVVKNNRENRRDIIKGVRSNRRFDLLMNMRNTNK